jgi:hypothetical protein
MDCDGPDQVALKSIWDSCQQQNKTRPGYGFKSKERK